MKYTSNRKEVEKELTKKQVTALYAIGEVVSGQAKALAPTDLSNLKTSYHYQVNEKEGSVTIGSPVEYAYYVEKGTGIYQADGKGRKTPWAYEDKNGEWVYTAGQKPQPHLMPAVDNNKKAINKMIEESYKD